MTSESRTPDRPTRKHNWEDNRTPTPGKNAWFARPRAFENETVSVESSEDDTATRDVVLSQVIDEPGKGSSNPPRREIRTPMNHRDAFTLAVHLAESALAVMRRNKADARTRTRKPFFSHRSGEPSRRMNEDFARINERLVGVVLGRLKYWQDEHPDVADYRVTGAIQAAAKLNRYLTYLSEDTTPDMDAARAELTRSGFFDGVEPGDQRRATARAVGIPEESDPGVLTGHAATDHPAARGLVPRVRAYGTYHETSNRDMRVQVLGLSASHVTVVPVDKDIDDGIEIPRNESDLFTLTLDKETDWVPFGEALGEDAGHATGTTESGRGKVPRLRALGRYYVTATASVRVQVVGVSTEHVELNALGRDALEYPDTIKAPRTEMGTWLTLDDPRHWVHTDEEAPGEHQ